MTRKLLIIFALIILYAMPGHAVLKESNLDTTLIMLRSELTAYHIQLEKESSSNKREREALFKEVYTIMDQANQTSLVLYSQKNGYIFDMAYACHEATELYKKFNRKATPFISAINDVNEQVNRYDSLINVLSALSMGAKYMSKEANINRNVCLTLAVNIRRQLGENKDELEGYVTMYKMTDRRLRTLNDYANQRYTEIQNNIFINGGDNYFKILSNLKSNLFETKESIAEKYRPTKHGIMSQWDVRIIGFLFGLIILYGCISALLNVLLIRGLITHYIKKGLFASFKDEFMLKRQCIIMAMTVITFAIILGIIRISVNQNFLSMACNLLVEYAWLLGVILISLLLRVKGEQIKSAFRIYTPVIAMGFIVIAIRIVLIPNDLVNMIFPPIQLLCTFWQLNVISRHNNNVPKSDMFYTWITLIVFIASVISSWSGYTLLSVQLLIWWVMQLTCILTITCITGWLKGIAIKKDYAHKDIRHTWLYILFYNMLLPALGVLTIVISIYWAADVFNLSDTCMRIFSTKYIHTKWISLSLFNVVQVLVMYFVFKYIINTLTAFLRIHFFDTDPSTAASKFMMIKHVLQILLWGIYILASVTICDINYTWFVVITGGISTGIGFAMKDILENIYYGISLMAGRIKIGDYIVCDGIRGRVSKISYTSTMLEAIDGSVMTFQNSQLFTKNYKNMTKNHGYELDILEVGVAYGTNIAEVKKYLIDSISKLDCIYRKKGVKVILKSFDDSCITLRVLVWVNVLTQAADDGCIMECIYNTFNEHGIEIPFPQREITIKHPDEETSDNNMTKETEASGKAK